jgi:hypothetical protein
VISGSRSHHYWAMAALPSLLPLSMSSSD